MSDYEVIAIIPTQFKKIDLALGGIRGSLEKLGDFALKDEFQSIVDAIDRQTADNGKWLSLIVEAIKSINTLPEPQPKPRGVIMATFKVAADNPDIVIELSGSGFTDSEGNPTGAGDIDLSVDSSNVDVLDATISGQAVSDDGQTVTAQVNLHFGAASPDMAALAYKAINRDTGALVAAGSDEFIVGAGEASVGSITSTVPLTPEP